MKQTALIIALFVVALQSGNTQCFPNRHSTSFYDGWISCEVADNPNPLRGKSHFIMYDYGKVYKLGQSEIWNTNDPSHLDWGMRDVVIDYSLDGISWAEAGQFTFPQGTGQSIYEGAPGPYLNNIEARYLLITGVNNYGGECYGFSEIKISAEEVIISDVEQVDQLACVDVTVYPNPFADKMTLTLSPGCSGDLRYIVYDGLGKIVLNQTANLINGQNKTIDVGQDLPAGAYNLYLEYGGKSTQRSIVKVSRT